MDSTPCPVPANQTDGVMPPDQPPPAPSGHDCPPPHAPVTPTAVGKTRSHKGFPPTPSTPLSSTATRTHPSAHPSQYLTPESPLSRSSNARPATPETPTPIGGPTARTATAAAPRPLRSSSPPYLPPPPPAVTHQPLPTADKQRTSEKRPPTHRAGAPGHDSKLLRRDWLIMLQSVLTGDILRRETQRLFSTSSWTEPDKKYALWLALRAIAHCHSVDEERRLVDAQRLQVDRILDDVLDFASDTALPMHQIRAQVSACLDRLDQARDLYPTEKAMRLNHPKLTMPECQGKIEILQTWLNMVTELEISTNVFKQWSGLAFVDVRKPVGGGATSAKGATEKDAEQQQSGSPKSGETLGDTGGPKSRPGTIRIVDFQGQRASSSSHVGEEHKACPGVDTYELHDGADAGKILESLLRGHELLLPLERRFVHELPKYLRRLKSTVIEHTDRFLRYQLPVPIDIIADLGQLPVRVVSELQRIRLAYAGKIRNATLPTLDQLLSDIKATMVVAGKVRQEFLDFFAPQPRWAPRIEDSELSAMESNLLRSVDLYFRLLDMSLCMEPNRIKEYEIMDSEWAFCGSLMKTSDPIVGLDALMVECFCALVANRFQQLRDLYMDAIKGAVKLNVCLDTLRMRSRHAKMFFSDLCDHVLRVAPLVLDRATLSQWEVPDETAVVEPWTTESHASSDRQHRQSCPSQSQEGGQLDPDAIAAGSAQPAPSVSHPRMVAFIQRLFDTGYRLVGHTEHQVFFFSRNPSVNVLEYLCTVPCNTQVLTSTQSLFMVYFPTAPSLFMCSPLISPRVVMGEDESAAGERQDQPSREQVRQGCINPQISRISHQVNSPLLPSEMLAPILLVTSSADAVAAACEEFQDMVPPSLHGRGLPLTRRLHVVMSELEASIARYAFSLLNGVSLVKETSDDAAMESLYTFASDFALRFSRMVHNPRRLLHRLLMFTVDWIKFTCAAYAQHQRGQPNRKTFRWALLSLEFTLNLCRGCNLFSSGFSIPVDSQPDHSTFAEAPVERKRSAMLSYRGGKIDARVLSLLTDSEFHSMRVAVGHCMALLISHFESFSPQLTWAETANQVPNTSRFFAGTQAKMIELEASRTESMRNNRLIGRVLDQSANERSLASLSSSQSSVSIRWQHGRFLGGGTFGSVYMGTNLSTGELMAVKEIRIHSTANFVSLKRMVQEEMRVMERLSHPNVVQYYGIEVHRDKVFLFMEYCAGGRLSNLVSEGGLEEPVIKRIVYQICLGLQYLHSLKVVHRDVKPDNILLDAAGNIKLVDFGAAKILSNQRTVAESSSGMSLIGTPNYLAPEAVVGSGGGHIGAQDIWSLGCVLLELYTGRPPWSHLDNQWAIIYHCAFSPPPVPENLKGSLDGLDFLKTCLQVNPRNRPTASELLTHSFLADEAAKQVSPLKPPIHRLISTLHTMPIMESVEEEEDDKQPAGAGKPHGKMD